jgi:dUTP pyrophosphatase
MKIHIKKLHPDAKVPSFANPGDAGMDIYCLENITVKSGERAQIRTGISMEFDHGYVALAWDKSSVAIKYGLKILGGVYDAGYRGEYIVSLHNLSDAPYTFEAGDKISQLIFQKVEHPEVELVDELTTSERGEGRFGSTGKK